MSVTILRMGLWSLVIILVAYVLKETSPHSPIAEIIEDQLLLTLAKVAIGTIALGIVVGIAEKTRFSRANRCKVCNTKIPDKSIYCRDHLREVLEEEDLRRRTMSTRFPD